MKFSLKNVLGLALFLFALCAHGSAINVYPLELNLNYQDRFHDVEVYNIGKDKAYVNLDISLIEHPGLPEQKELPLEDNPYQVGLIVTPNKMVIPPGQMRIARMLFIGEPPKQDLMYKVRIAPATGQYMAVSDRKGVVAGVNVIIAYSVNVYMRPLKPVVKVTITRIDHDLIFNNQGNTNVLIGNCQQCPDKNPENCKNFGLSKRIYAGAVYHYQVPELLPVTCEQFFEDSPETKLISN